MQPRIISCVSVFYDFRLHCIHCSFTGCSVTVTERRRLSSRVDHRFGAPASTSAAAAPSDAEGRIIGSGILPVSAITSPSSGDNAEAQATEGEGGSQIGAKSINGIPKGRRLIFVFGDELATSNVLLRVFVVLVELKLFEAKAATETRCVQDNTFLLQSAVGHHSSANHVSPRHAADLSTWTQAP